MFELDTATVTMDCIGSVITYEVRTPFDTLATNGGKATFPVGIHEVIYEAVDTCGNSDTDTMYVTVADSTPPVAVCAGLRTLALDGTGMAWVPARVFDGGSHDECLQVWFKARRVSPPVGYDCTDADNPNYMLADKVKFCCEDIGDTIMILLRVYDQDPGDGVVSEDTLEGKFADCMARMLVLDKSPPVLTCPPDTTIDCDVEIDLDGLGLPTFNDNCDSISFDITIIRDIGSCGTGTIIRRIIGTDAGGLQDTCDQTIFVIDMDPFDGLDTNDLKWPDPFVTIYDCRAMQDTNASGGPIVRDDECSQVTVSWEDDIFHFNREACAKIIRHWKVTDWCQYDPRVNSACIPDNGCWTYDQIIKVLDTVPPVLIVPKDTIIPNYTVDCGSIQVNLDTAIYDTCFFGEEIIVTIEVDLFCDESIDTSFAGTNASGIYPPGRHKVIFTAEDACHNLTIDTTIVTIKDSVLPTPIAMNGLTAVLVNMGNGLIMTTIHVNQLNASSYDNCTAAEDLKFSFSPNVSDTTLILDCDDLPVITVQLWATDECGNQDYVEVIIVVQDPDGHCTTTSNIVSITGNIVRYDNEALEEMEVMAKTSAGELMTKTDTDGKYRHDNLIKSQTYEIIPSTTGNPTAGISTRDLILIQRHLLGKREFASPQQYIAADANGSGHVSATDIVNIRALLLGRENRLKINKEWVSIPADFHFTNPQDPFETPWPESYMVHNLEQSIEVDFLSIKMGDIDNSYSRIVGNENRHALSMTSKYDDLSQQVEIFLSQDMWISGLQLEVGVLYANEIVNIESQVLEEWGSHNFALDANGTIAKISWNQDEAYWIPKDVPMLTFKIDPRGGMEPVLVLKEGLEPEIYDDEVNVKVIEFANHTNDPDHGFQLISFEPNPFTDESICRIQSSGEVPLKLEIHDLMGNTILTKELSSFEGIREVAFDHKAIPNTGIYVLTVFSEGWRRSIRIVRMD